jgi:hypothetical protein
LSKESGKKDLRKPMMFAIDSRGTSSGSDTQGTIIKGTTFNEAWLGEGY